MPDEKRRTKETLGAEGPFRIATVAELTDVPEPTLRAWERRYGIPSPLRTASGYRLYSAAEVEQVRQMRRLCDGGMAAAEAATLVRAKARPSRAPTLPAAEDPYESMVEDIVAAVEHFDDHALDHLMRQLLLLGTSSTIFERIVAPALRTIGDKWQRGEISVAHEHLVSQRLSAVLRDILRLGPGNESADRVLLGCFADDEHELGLLGVAVRVAELGFRPVFLGARTPPSAIRGALDASSPALVGLSVTMTPTRPRTRELLEEYARACGRTPWIVGGRAAKDVADLTTKLGGHVAGEDGTVLVDMLRGAASRPASARRIGKK